MNKLLTYLLLIVVGFAIYANSLHGEMLFDDYYYITTNESIRQISNVSGMWKVLDEPTRFIGFLSFALNYHYHELETFGYHLFNTIIHILVACLVHWFILLICGSPYGRKQNLDQQKNVLALCVALLFLVHPIQTQAVSYISQRFTSIAALFYILTLCLYIQGRLKKSFLSYCGAFLSALFGMFTKEIVFTLPFALVLIEYAFLNDEQEGALKNKKGIWIVGLLFLLIIPGLFSFDIQRIFFDPRVSGSHQREIITSGLYFLTQLRVLVVYLKLLVFPVGLNLDYDFALSRSLFEGPTFLSGLVLLALFGLGIKLWSRHRMIAFGIFWFFLTLAVESTFIPIQHVIFEHRLYLPSIGFFIVVVVTIVQLIKNRKIFGSLIVLLVVLLSFLTVQRNKVWQNQFTLWGDVITKSPNKARPYFNLGNAYFDKGEYPTAMQLYNKTLALDSKHEKAYNSRGVIHKETGQIQAALADYNRAIELKPRFTRALSNRAIVHYDLGQLDLALQDCMRAIEIDPYFGEAYSNRGVIYQKMGKFYFAIDDFTTALSYNPDLDKTYNNRGAAYSKIGDLEKALADYNASIKLKPNEIQAYDNRAKIYWQAGRFQEALDDFNMALLLNQNYQPAYLGLGVVHGMMGHHNEAIKNLSKAIELNPRDGIAYFNRSVMHQTLGDIQKALEDAQKAHGLGYPNMDQRINQLKSQLIVE